MSFLDALDEAQKRELEALLVPEQHADGEWLFREGDLATGAHLVRSGAVDLTLTLPGGEPHPITRIGPGGFFGEPALLRDGRRQLSARAVGPTRVDALDRFDFQGLRHGYRPVSFTLLLEIARLVGRRLQEADSGMGIGAPGDGTTASPLGATEAPGCSFEPLQFLRELPFFSDLSSRDHVELLTLGTLWELPRGRLLLRTGQQSDRCFVVVRGAVEAVNAAAGQRVALFGPGSPFGQLAPLLGTPVIADCRMREAGVVLELGPEALDELLHPRRRLSYRFLNALCLALLGGLAQANRVLARAENARRTS